MAKPKLKKYTKTTHKHFPTPPMPTPEEQKAFIAKEKIFLMTQKIQKKAEGEFRKAGTKIMSKLFKTIEQLKKLEPITALFLVENTHEIIDGWLGNVDSNDAWAPKESHTKDFI